ncbi:maltose/maltodextrin ABC transporter substrate-binding protein MalE [Iodobacter ciconiae]|uniref:Maltodextrin-binding protein n=1 Tax=Iodobacter ciconiae TaxID=2496266 RepID=A0A3S8ZR85_9NEIS|nr:maltose/maltodextrin ABC transporter substrate-binding protein MalE [Iodobacter ciconiae]AZN35925.1 maltose/maltodextrin ABC transporter substrate-binding protein MalE [Iodobacter ciconiae]
MNTTRRQFGKFAVSSIAAALAIAISGPAFAADKLVIWVNGDKGYKGIEKVGAAFTKATGVEVVVEHPEDAPSKFQQSAAAGKGPDIWIWPHDRLGEWMTAGLLNPITPSKKVQAEIDPLAWKAFTVNGKQWGYPIAIEALALIYNKDLVPVPPKSFDDVMALDKKLAAQGKKAILWDYGEPYFSWPLLAAGGAYAFKPKADGTYDAKDVGVNNAGAIAGLETINKMIKTGVMPKSATYADMEAGVNQGKIAMMINGPWAWDNLKKSKINWGVAPIPTINGKPGAPFVGVLGAMLNRSSKNKELAVEFLENHMLTVAGLKTINADVPLGVPANKAFFNELKANPAIQASMESAKAGQPMPNIPEMGRFWASLKSALQNVTQGRQTPKQGLDAAAARIASK